MAIPVPRLMGAYGFGSAYEELNWDWLTRCEGAIYVAVHCPDHPVYLLGLARSG